LAQIAKLKSSPVLSKLIDEEKLKIAGAYYDLDTGKISVVG
jgi:carbonic anhydrase